MLGRLEKDEPDAVFYRRDRRSGAGHVGIDRDNRLIELHLDDAYLPLRDEVFGVMLAKRRIGTAIVKSFDQAFVACCETRRRGQADRLPFPQQRNRHDG